jgi:hypothetical protein
MALQLVQQGFTNAALFAADGEVVQAAEVLHKHPILLERGRFRPVTRATADMLECGRREFGREPLLQGEDIAIIMEMTLKNLAEDGFIDHQDFLDRMDLLRTLGVNVLISNYGPFYRLAGYLFRYTRKMIGIVMGVPTLQEVFEEKYYADLEGGILESFGRLFKNALKIYVYPYRDPAAGRVLTADNLAVAPHLRHLYGYLKENDFIRPLSDIDAACLPVFSDDVLAFLHAGDAAWEQMVPPQVARVIKERRLFGFKG